jgi:hypothetical protein
VVWIFKAVPADFVINLIFSKNPKVLKLGGGKTAVSSKMKIGFDLVIKQTKKKYSTFTKS